MTLHPSLNEVPKEPAIRRAWVLFQLRIRGYSLATIAKELGVSRQTVRLALVEPRARVEPAIAAKLGLRVQDLFPERFDNTGRRLHADRSRKPSRARSTRNVQVPGAA